MEHNRFTISFTYDDIYALLEEIKAIENGELDTRVKFKIAAPALDELCCLLIDLHG